MLGSDLLESLLLQRMGLLCLLVVTLFGEIVDVCLDHLEQVSSNYVRLLSLLSLKEVYNLDAFADGQDLPG